MSRDANFPAIVVNNGQPLLAIDDLPLASEPHVVVAGAYVESCHGRSLFAEFYR